MIRNLLATTAIATLVATGAMAQTTTSPTTTSPGVSAPAEPAQPMVKHAEGHLASDIIGKSVYSGTGDDAQNIGKVSDLVLDDNGTVKALVVGVGGFLSIGQKEVALQYDLASWAERDGDEWLVVETTADKLKALPDFDSAAYKPMPADADVTETKPATKEDLANAPSAEEGAATEDETGAATDEQSPAVDDTDTGATTGDEPADSATGTETDEPAMDSDTGTSTDTDTMQDDDAAQ